MKTRYINLAILILIFTLVTAGVCQATGDLNGTVTDINTSKPIKDAQGTAKNKDNPGEWYTLKTNEAGYYSQSGMTAGKYNIAFSAAGYDSKDDIVTIPEGETLTYDIALTPVSTNLPPVASFTYSSGGGTTVNFDGSSSSDPDGTITNYSWDFGDTCSDSGVTVSHTYAIAGNYKVNLTVTDDDGVTGLTGQTVYAGETGSLAGTITDSATGKPIKDATVSILNQNLVAKTNEFGQYTISNIPPNPAYTAKVGAESYDIQLIAISIEANQTTTLDVALVASKLPPVAIINATYRGGKTVSFDGTSSFDPDGGLITDYAWDFGDGATGSGAIVEHSYPALGYYIVSLTVTDDEGATNTTSQQVGTYDFGAIRGQVTNSLGKPVEHATVKLIANDAIIAEKETAPDGKYDIKAVPVGLYTIKVSHAGYDAYIENNILIEKNKTTEKNIVLTGSGPGDTGVFKGGVRTKAENNPIEGATIASDDGQTTLSGADGSFVLQDTVGTHNYSCTKSGYTAVVAINIVITKDKATYYDFSLEKEVSSTPGKVLLKSPANGATGVGLNTALAWYAADNAAVYHIKVGLNAEFKPEIFKGETSHLSVIMKDQAYKTTYYWTIIAANAKGEFGPPSEVWTFTTAEEGAQTDGIFKGIVREALHENPIPGPIAELLCVDNGKIIPVGKKDGSFSVGWPAGQYTMQASAKGYESYQQSITVVGGKTTFWYPFLWPESSKVTGPTLLAPPNGSLGSAQFTLVWEPVKGTTMYYFEVANSPTFIGANIGKTAETKFQNGQGLSITANPNETIYWRVRAYSDQEKGKEWLSQWSDFWKFRIKGEKNPAKQQDKIEVRRWDQQTSSSNQPLIVKIAPQGETVNKLFVTVNDRAPDKVYINVEDNNNKPIVSNLSVTKELGKEETYINMLETLQGAGAAEGTYKVKIITANGNTKQIEKIIYDTTSPKLDISNLSFDSLLQPLALEELTVTIKSDGQALISGQAEDNLSGIMAITAKLGEEQLAETTPDEAGAFSLSIPGSQLAAGANIVTIEAEDGAGNTAQVQITITVDSTAPAISDITFNGQAARSGDYICAAPTIEFKATDASSIDPASLEVKIDGSALSGLTFDPATGLATVTVTTALADGAHTVMFKASDTVGNTAELEMSGLMVSSQLRLSEVLNMPNPFGEAGTAFTYQLTSDADITIKVFTVRGQQVKTITAAAGAEGGRAGFNSLAWDGRDESGGTLANGVYLYLVSARNAEGQMITARGKAAKLQ